LSTIEVILLRASGIPLAELREAIHASVSSMEADAEIVQVYRRHGLDTDMAVHIRHRDDGPPQRSKLGLSLAASLESHGSVQHTVWILV
jgi:hypothetical protein